MNFNIKKIFEDLVREKKQWVLIKFSIYFIFGLIRKNVEKVRECIDDYESNIL
jgi:hypothetical protein